MVIDDDPLLLGFTGMYLTRLGYTVATYLSMEQAWREFSSPATQYGLVLLDLSLTGLPAEQLSRMMLSANPAVRLILMSGYPLENEKLPGGGSDRLAFLQKPFTPATLAEAVGRSISPADVN